MEKQYLGIVNLYLELGLLEKTLLETLRKYRQYSSIYSKIQYFKLIFSKPKSNLHLNKCDSAEKIDSRHQRNKRYFGRAFLMYSTGKWSRTNNLFNTNFNVKVVKNWVIHSEKGQLTENGHKIKPIYLYMLRSSLVLVKLQVLQLNIGRYFQ